MEYIIFTALMKKLEIKSLVSGDKAARLLLEFRADDDKLISGLNGLMKADDEVKVTIGK
jgi:hypothetical protein